MQPTRRATTGHGHPAAVAPWPASGASDASFDQSRRLDAVSSDTDSEYGSDSAFDSDTGALQRKRRGRSVSSSSSVSSRSERSGAEADEEEYSSRAESCEEDESSSSSRSTGTSDVDEDDELRLTAPRGKRLHTMPVLSRDNLGVVALLIPFTGILTMVLTELVACTHHFDCSTKYPTLSYAATFKPEGHVFTIGMCATAVFILATVLLFCWYLRLRGPGATRRERAITNGCGGAGVLAALSLTGLAVMDMRAHHDAHIAFTVIFFISAWATMVFAQLARGQLLWQDKRPLSPLSACRQVPSATILLALQHWRRMNVAHAYALGRACLGCGLGSTVLFGLMFLCVNGMWPNPLHFTAVQEAFFEALAIVCQLLYMGTLSCELALLNRTVEKLDYIQLQRSE